MLLQTLRTRWILLAVLAAAVWAGPLAFVMVGSDSVYAASGCRPGNPLANVWGPSRLIVKSACRTVSGTITHVDRHPDGDGHIWMRVDSQYAWLLNAVNRQQNGGALILEIVPADKPGCSKGHWVKDGICTGAKIPTPRVGAHVTATGPYVLDKNHGWMEIHPVWALH